MGNRLLLGLTGGPAESPRLAPLRDPLGEPEVDHLDVSPGVQEEVLRLQVPVDDPPGVEVIDGGYDAGHVEPGGGVVEPAAVAQDGPQLAAQAGLHQEVDVLAVAERAVEVGDELK